MPLSMQQVQKLSQRLVMTPQMQQSLKLLQMNTLELEELTQQELLENPFLEMMEDENEYEEEPRDGRQEGVLERQEDETERDESDTDSQSESDISDDISEGVEAGAMEDCPEQFEEVDLDWNESFDDDSDADSGKSSEEENWAEIFNTTGPRTYRPPAPDDSDERSFEETVAGQSSLYEKLDWQLRVSALTGKDLEIARFLIGSIDDRGYLQTRSTIEECAQRNNTTPEKIEEILDTLEKEGPQDSVEAQDWVDFAHERWNSGKDQKIADDLAGLVALQRRRPEVVVIHRSPTIEACYKQFGVDKPKVLEILSIIQEFDPPGVGARDLAECLCIQLNAVDRLGPHSEVILREHWDALLRRQFRKIARAIECDEKEVSELFEHVKCLDPSPGLHYTKDQPVYISPDVYVREVDGEYRVYMHEGEVANLRLSKTYKDILLNQDDPNQTEEEREYAIEKYRAAVQFIRNVEKRRSTVVRVTEAIMDYQKEFLENGVESLRPLSLSEIAEVVGMHESTISRVTSGKYVDTPQGLFELKYFFSSAIESSGGEATSSRAIKNMIREMIESENPKKPLSDDKIAKRLESKGFTIARRTVAKYREQMKILPTNLRRHAE